MASVGAPGADYQLVVVVVGGGRQRLSSSFGGSQRERLERAVIAGTKSRTPKLSGALLCEKPQT